MDKAKLKFIGPGLGVFLEITFEGHPLAQTFAAKILRQYADDLENTKLTCAPLPDKKSIAEIGVCCWRELNLTYDGENYEWTPCQVIMQDGSVHKIEKKPDGTWETFEEIVEREWEVAEVRRTAMGLD